MKNIDKKIIKLLGTICLVIAFILSTSLSLSAKNIPLSIRGVTTEISSSIQEALSSNNLDLDPSSKLLQNNIITETQNILAIYGYYDPDVKLEFQENNLIINIKKNKPVIIRNININTIDNNEYTSAEQTLPKAFNTIIKNYNKQVNKPLNQIFYESFKGELLQTAHNYGYIDAYYQQHKIIIDKKKRFAVINVNLDLKSLYTIKKITIINNKDKLGLKPINNISNDFIFEFFPYQYKKIDQNTIKLLNAPYRSFEILELQNNLSAYFREVYTDTNVDSVNKTIDLTLKITPIRNYFYSIGLGFSTDEGARTFGNLQIRNITPFAHKLDLQGKIAEYREIAEANYILPGLKPSNDTATFGYQFRSDKKRSNNNLEKERHQIIGQYQRSLYSGNLQLTSGISYRTEKYRDIANGTSRTSQLLVPYFIYDHILTANRIKTYLGHHINIMLEAANDDIMSDTSFVRLHTKLKSIIPLNVLDDIKGLRVIGKGQFGQVWHQKERKIPPTLRFFAGGTDTVRGYRFESLGPREINAKGKPIIVGGDRLAVIGVELEKTLYQNWSAAVFYDTGNAYDTWSKWRNNLQSSVGFGVRWQSPLGPLRFDIASALDKEGQPWRADFNIGPDL